MTDGPQQCALPGCNEMVEQPEDGGPRRLYCSPAHRAAARKARHAARMDAAPAVPAAAAVTQPVAQAPKDEASEQPTTELPAPLGVDPRQEEPEPAAVPDREWSPAAAWTVAPPTLPSPRTVRTITSKRVKKRKPVRMAGDRQSSGTHIGKRAIASVAIASLVAGGASYFVSQNVIPTTPTPLPPQAANQPSMDADVWADKAQVVLASLSSQLDAVAQAEASWLALPAQRRAQEPAAVQALKDRKALLEQQRAILMSQLEAFKALPERTSELTSAQAQLDAVERTLTESTTTAASPDYKEALRQLESQREIVRQQRDHAAQALTDLRNGVDQALSSPLPAEKDETSPIVERVKAVVAGRPDPGEKDDDKEHEATDGQDPATTPRREDGDKERGDVGTTAPPDPERPNTPDILADGGRSQDSKGDDKPENAGQSDNAGQSENAGRSENPVQSVAGSLNRALGQGDTSNRDERANKRETRGAQGDEDRSDDERSNSSRGNSGGGLGDVVRGVSGGLLGGSDRDDDSDDDSSSARRGSSDEDRSEREDRDDDRGSKSDRSGWGSDRDDDSDDDRGSRRDRDDDDDDRGLVRGITDGLLGGDRDDDEDSDRKRPSGKAERQRDKDRGESKHDSDKSDSDEKDSDSDERADEDNDRKRPSGKAERQRDKDRGESKHDSDRSDSDEKDSDDDEDSGKHKDRGSDDDDSDKGDSDKGDSDKDSDKGDSDKGKDDGDSDDDGGDDGDDGGKSDKKDKGDGDSDSGDSDSGDSGSGDSDSGGDDD
ncbi:hypothetical protein [Pseudonocardia cypriaca]|uniref:Uncharacterized protein n=1 Tax=Pseudonocardia cypriaca TaxID=882449 RepID=A0A543FVU5_9PSEU|nr:hypothetical protein [Pseudonocardia cypriaca]TQM37864.1 hypothetical protein FB388_5083 [Pseudonocardia cypriaca]